MRRIRKGTIAVLACGCLLAAGLIVVLFHHFRPEEIPALGRELTPSLPPRPVVVSGWHADTMEPFITRDGRYLLFNNLNESPVNTDIFYAERQDDFNWRFCGPVQGINTPALEGCATMDRTGRMFFVSPRSYDQTFCTIYTGRFKAGYVSEVQVVDSISRKQPGLVNFDVDVSPDGTMLVFVDSRFLPILGPKNASLVIANWDGTHFLRSPDSTRILATINQAGLNYAPTISGDKLTLFFTRFDPHSQFKGPQIYRATRPNLMAPFDAPRHVAGLGDYVEGSAFGPDEQMIYFHRKDGAKFNLYAISLR